MTHLPDRGTGDNRLAVLAANIQTLHKSTQVHLRRSVEQGIQAGELLIEAKGLLEHGRWLPWLRDHCGISERTAQLYMRLARNRETIEANAKSATVADLTLNETAALLMLSSDVRNLLAFARDSANLSGEELIERCIAEGFAVIKTPDYNPFAGRTDAERLEGDLFVLFLSRDGTERARDSAARHVEWLLQRPFQNVAEWLGPEGAKFRAIWRMRQLDEKFKAAWHAFLVRNSKRNQREVTQELMAPYEQGAADG